MTDRLKPTGADNTASAANTSEAVVKNSSTLDFTPSAKTADIVAPDAAGLVSFAPTHDLSAGPIIIDEEELKRDFSSAFHLAAEKRDSREFPIPDLYKDHD